MSNPAEYSSDAPDSEKELDVLHVDAQQPEPVDKKCLEEERSKRRTVNSLMEFWGDLAPSVIALNQTKSEASMKNVIRLLEQMRGILNPWMSDEAREAKKVDVSSLASLQAVITTMTSKQNAGVLFQNFEDISSIVDFLFEKKGAVTQFVEGPQPNEGDIVANSRAFDDTNYQNPSFLVLFLSVLSHYCRIWNTKSLYYAVRRPYQRVHDRQVSSDGRAGVAGCIHHHQLLQE